MLRSYPLGEGDRLVSFLSRENGKLRGVARGARSMKSRFGSCLETLSHIRVWYFERETRELVRINQCELVESFLDAQRDYRKGVAIALISEATDFVLQEREPASPQFRLLLLTARAIQQADDPWPPLAYFALWTLKLAGWLPSLDNCGRCGREFSGEENSHAASQGIFVCVNCKLPGSRVISPQALASARFSLHNKFAVSGTSETESLKARELFVVLLDWIEFHIEKKLNSRRLLEEGLEQRN